MPVRTSLNIYLSGNDGAKLEEALKLKAKAAQMSMSKFIQKTLEEAIGWNKEDKV